MSKRWWAAVVALVLVGGCSLGDDGQGDDGQGDEAGRGGEIVDLTGSVVGARGVLIALDDEHNFSVLSAVGVVGPGDDSALAELRDAVDEKLAAVGVADDGGVFPSSEEVASTLTELRRQVDAAAGPAATIAQYDLAIELHRRFRALADGYRAAGRDALPELVDDPVLREGLDLQFLAADVIEAEADIVFWMYGYSLDQAPAGPDDIAELSRLATEQSQSIDALKSAEHEPYRRVIESTFPDEQHEAMNGFVERALNGEPVSLLDVLATVTGESPETAPYVDLVHELAVAVEAAAPPG